MLELSATAYEAILEGAKATDSTVEESIAELLELVATGEYALVINEGI
jgi:hypothetical protein